MKNSKQECPKCNKLVVTFYKPSWEHEGPYLCYWCNKRRIKEEKQS
ncbi:Phage protein [Bacillus manliponensis]